MHIPGRALGKEAEPTRSSSWACLPVRAGLNEKPAPPCAMGGGVAWTLRGFPMRIPIPSYAYGRLFSALGDEIFARELAYLAVELDLVAGDFSGVYHANCHTLIGQRFDE